jgi:hypothetical protein
MKKLLLALAIAALPSFGFAAPLQDYQPGFRLIDGTQLNLMVDVVNNLTGNGTPQAVTGTSGTFTGVLSGSGGFTLTGTTGTSGLICGSYYFTGTPAATDQVFFIATRAMRVVSISQIHSVAAGGASTLQVTKDTGTDAPGAGTDLLTNNTNTGFDLNATANTIQTGTLVATAGVTTLAAGNRLAVDFANAIGTSAGVVVTACMAPL